MPTKRAILDTKEDWDVGHLNTDISKRVADDDPSNGNYVICRVLRRSNISSRLYRNYALCT